MNPSSTVGYVPRHATIPPPTAPPTDQVPPPDPAPRYDAAPRYHRPRPPADPRSTARNLHSGILGADVPVHALIRNHDFQALWISRFFASIGKETADVAYPLLILAVTGSATYAGTVGAVQLGVVGFIAITGGALADRIDRRRLLIACDTARVVLLGLFSVLIALDLASIPLVFVIVVGSAACVGISEPAALAGIKQIVQRSHLTRATAQNQVRPLGATVVGTPIGSSLFAVGRAIPFVATALAFTCSATLLWFIRKPMQAALTGNEDRRHVVAGFRYVVRQPVLLVWMVWVMGSNMAFNHTGAFLALIATAKQRGAPESTVGLMLAIAGGGGLVGAMLATTALARLRASTLFLMAAWSGPVAALALAVVPGVLPLGFILASVFLRGPIVNALFFAYVAVLVPDRLQGRVMGAVMFLSYVAQPIGIFAIGSIFDTGGPIWVFLMMCAVSTLAALPTLTRRIRRLPAPEEMVA